MRSLAALALPAVACGFFWNPGNQPLLERDVADAFAVHAVGAIPDCHLLGTTGNAVCTVHLPGDEVSAVVSGYAMVPAAASDLPGGYQAWESLTGCRKEPGFAESSGPAVYTTSGVPGFQYWILYHDPSKGRVCIQLAPD